MANEYKSIYTGQEVDEAVAIAQKAVTTDNVAQTTGPSQTNVMSQAAVTAALSQIESEGTIVTVSGVQQETWEANTKINVYQGAENAGKAFMVGNDGNAILKNIETGISLPSYVDFFPNDTDAVSFHNSVGATFIGKSQVKFGTEPEQLINEVQLLFPITAGDNINIDASEDNTKLVISATSGTNIPFTVSKFNTFDLSTAIAGSAIDCWTFNNDTTEGVQGISIGDNFTNPLQLSNGVYLIQQAGASDKELFIGKPKSLTGSSMTAGLSVPADSSNPVVIGSQNSQFAFKSDGLYLNDSKIGGGGSGDINLQYSTLGPNQTLLNTDWWMPDLSVTNSVVMGYSTTDDSTKQIKKISTVGVVNGFPKMLYQDMVTNTSAYINVGTDTIYITSSNNSDTTNLDVKPDGVYINNEKINTSGSSPINTFTYILPENVSADYDGTNGITISGSGQYDDGTAHTVTAGLALPIIAGEGISIAKDTESNKLTISATGGSGGNNPIVSFSYLINTSDVYYNESFGIEITGEGYYSDNLGGHTIPSAGMSLPIIAGEGISITPNENNNQIIISSTGSGGSGGTVIAKTYSNWDDLVADFKNFVSPGQYEVVKMSINSYGNTNTIPLQGTSINLTSKDIQIINKDLNLFSSGPSSFLGGFTMSGAIQFSGSNAILSGIYDNYLCNDYIFINYASPTPTLQLKREATVITNDGAMNNLYGNTTFNLSDITISTISVLYAKTN